MILEDANRKLGKPVREGKKTENDVIKATATMDSCSSAHGAGAGRGAQTGGAVPPAVCMLKYSVKPVCGAAVWGTSGW